MDTTQKRPQEGREQKRRPAAEQPRHSAEPRKAGNVQTEQRPRRPKEAPAEQQPRRPREAPAEQRPRRPKEAPAEQRPHRPKEAPARNQSKPRPRPEEKTRPPQRRRKESDDTLGGKPRAYGRTKPKKKSGLSRMGGMVRKGIQRSSDKAKARRTDKNHGHPQQPTPAVIYTEPKAFNRRRFTVQLLTVTAVALALVLGLSLFFKVENITVSGAQVYSAWSVREASGISEGDNLLSFGNARAGALIKANLPYVNKVRIGIKLPDTVNIIIEEEDVVYAIKSQDELWWLMTSDGKVVEQSSGGQAASYTQILGVNLDNPVSNAKAVAAENVPVETAAEGSESAPAVVTGAQRLDAALQIVRALEANDIVGEAASVDVSQIEDIELWYGSRYQVKLGDSTQLDYKITCMNDAILQLSDYQSGILDLSFRIWPDKVVYSPFA